MSPNVVFFGVNEINDLAAVPAEKRVSGKSSDIPDISGHAFLDALKNNNFNRLGTVRTIGHPRTLSDTSDIHIRSVCMSSAPRDRAGKINMNWKKSQKEACR
jgi:hypothetical protein